MLPFQLQKLPNEIILKVFSYLETKDLIQYGHVSKRIRDICHDESLWKKINLYDKIGQFFYLVIYFFDISKSHNGYILVVSLIFQCVFVSMSGSCHLDNASNVEIGVECQIFVIVIFNHCS